MRRACGISMKPYRGIRTAVSCPRPRKAAGSAPTTSASPPVLANGAASEAAMRMRKTSGSRGRYALGRVKSAAEECVQSEQRGGKEQVPEHGAPVERKRQRVAGRKTGEGVRITVPERGEIRD